VSLAIRKVALPLSGRRRAPSFVGPALIFQILGGEAEVAVVCQLSASGRARPAAAKRGFRKPRRRPFLIVSAYFTAQPGAKARRFSVAAVASVRRAGRADAPADGGEPARAEPFGLSLPGQAGISVKVRALGQRRCESVA
jgi:hypothetical protein